MEASIADIKKFLICREEADRASKLKEREYVISGLGALSHLWQRYKIKRIYLYGGFADMSFCKHSDIDIAVDGDIDFESLLELFSELNRHFKREVDVRLLKELPFKEKVIKEGILIYERENTHTQKRNTKRSGKIKQPF